MSGKAAPKPAPAANPAAPAARPATGPREPRTSPRGAAPEGAKREPREVRAPRGEPGTRAPAGGAGGERPPRPSSAKGRTAPEVADEPGTLRIRATSKPKAVAGAVANKLRGGEVFRVNGIGADSVNQAVKAIAIARSYLKDDSIDLSILPSHLEDVGPDVISLSVASHAPTADEPAPEAACFKAAASTVPGSLAGALAAKIREGVTKVSVTSVGPLAALRSVKSIALAAEYVKEDGFTVYAVPFFVDLKLDNEERTGIRVDVFASK